MRLFLIAYVCTKNQTSGEHVGGSSRAKIKASRCLIDNEPHYKYNESPQLTTTDSSRCHLKISVVEQLNSCRQIYQSFWTRFFGSRSGETTTIDSSRCHLKISVGIQMKISLGADKN